MNLTLADKLALIYTAAGSQRNIAALVGISHQKVGRILKTGSAGGFDAKSKALRDPNLIAAVNQAFNIHSQVAKEQARADKLPFSSEVPIFYERMPLMNGAPGDRVAARHTHWLSDKLRGRWVGVMQKTGKFYALSVQSIVNLKVYTNRAEKGNQGRKRTDLQKLYRKEFKLMTAQKMQRGPVNTPYTPLDQSFPLSDILADISRKLQEKHAPAMDDKSTLASQILLQVDTSNAATKVKARGNKRGPGGNRRRKAV